MCGSPDREESQPRCERTMFREVVSSVNCHDEPRTNSKFVIALRGTHDSHAAHTTHTVARSRAQPSHTNKNTHRPDVVDVVPSASRTAGVHSAPALHASTAQAQDINSTARGIATLDPIESRSSQTAPLSLLQLRLPTILELFVHTQHTHAVTPTQ